MKTNQFARVGRKFPSSMSVGKSAASELETVHMQRIAQLRSESGMGQNATIRLK